MGSGFSKMKKQARLMQNQVKQANENLAQMEIIGTAGNGLVKITIDGSKKLKKILIQPECCNTDDVEGLQDLIFSAFEDATNQIEKLELTV